ncbi:hypothetical protein EAG_16073 [Camponotus floridanus]|uniref:BED-type domain-containing protein n=1 Tax=Camponotus floridanus TaxID=104421 RepID=E2A2F3_CAMFO|nr:hypothetical protein EAG_16073 [Camponotus floridanus]
MSMWIWNYFTLEGLCKARCSLCDEDYKPRLVTTKNLKDHIEKKKNNDSEHLLAYGKISEILIRASEEMREHLKKDHEIEERNWQGLRADIHLNARNYYDDGQEENGVIKVDICKKCYSEIRAKNAIMFVKHLDAKHHECQIFLSRKHVAELNARVHCTGCPRFEDPDTSLAILVRDKSGVKREKFEGFSELAEIADGISRDDFAQKDFPKEYITPLITRDGKGGVITRESCSFPHGLRFASRFGNAVSSVKRAERM